jgi:hypothetical protein
MSISASIRMTNCRASICATLGRPTIHQIAARAIISFEFRVEAQMPLIVAHAVVSLLRLRAYTKKHEGTTKQADERASFHRITSRQVSRS